MDGRPLTKKGLKTSYRPTHLIPPLHTQGPVLVTPDGERLITTTGEDVLLTEVKTGKSLGRVLSDTTEVTSMALSQTGVLAVFTRSLALRYYTVPDYAPSPSSSDFISLTPSSSSSTLAAPPTLSLIRHTPRSHPAPVLVSTIDPTSTLLASGSADGIVKVWDLAGGYVTHLFRSHGGPVSSLAFNIPRSGPAKGQRMELITGSGDTKVRVFDLKDSNAGGKPRAVLDGHVSVVRGLGVGEEGRWLVSGGRDKVVLVWDLWGGDENGWERLGTTGAPGGKKAKGKGKAVDVQLVKTITALESLESVGVLNQNEVLGGEESEDGGAAAKGDRLVCWTAGEKGVVRIWDARRGTELVSLKGAEGVDVADASVDDDEGEEQRGIVEVIYNPSTSSLISVHSDQNILFHSLRSHSSSALTRQLIGYNDEIIDSLFLSPSSSSRRDTHIALATNSSLIRIYSTKSFDARLLPGHTDMVLCLDKSKDGSWLVSGSKDRTARIWAFNPTPTADDDEAGEWKCIAICEGHAESIGAVALSRKAPDDPSSPLKAKFLFTASQDRTIKMWDLSSIDLSSPTPTRLKSLLTQKIHDKDINSLDLSPNDRLLASGSQDKMVKVFEVSYAAAGKQGGQSNGDVKLVGTCKGHKRGVWSVKFSKTDRVLATGSGDKTVRIWSLDDYSCLKTFEGHSNSVLRVDFLSAGQQLLSSSSDGLVKLWNTRDESCVASLDNHEDKIWALAVSEDEKTIVSGAADSVVTFWGDCTEVDEKEKVQKLEKLVANEQNFTNYVNLKDYRNAILLALAMSQPGRLLSLFTSVRSSRPPPPITSTLLLLTPPTTPGTSSSPVAADDSMSITGSAAVDQVIKTLPPVDLVRLMGHVRDWNARAKTSPIAQTVLHAILRLRTAEEIIASFNEAAAVPPPSLSTAAAAEQDEAEAAKAKAKKASKKKVGQVGAGLDLGEILDAMVPYTERHFERAERMVQESFVLDFALSEMDGGLFGAVFDDEPEEEGLGGGEEGEMDGEEDGEGRGGDASGLMEVDAEEEDE